MKKNLLVLVLALLLTACGETPAPPADPALTQLRERTAAVGASFAVAFLGHVSDPGELTQLSPLPDIPPCVVDEGQEGYCLVPQEGDAVTICDLQGTVLYEGNDQPVLLLCNRSQVEPNLTVTVTKPDGSVITFAPALGLCDGTMALPADANIYDFSRYETLLTAAPAVGFVGTWAERSEPLRLTFYEDGSMTCQTSETLLRGTWYEIDENAHYPAGSILFEMADTTNPAAEDFWGVFTVQPEGDTLTVTHIAGNPLMYGFENQSLTFVNEE